MTTTHTINITAPPGDVFQLGHLRELLASADVPDSAHITPILKLDPVTVLRGVTVTWTTA